jgi:NAD(P)-dependent dehydrogenase (short-subunit alcohol dehydrogenase family)
MPAILVTGASRGIGLGLCRVYAQGGWHIFACCRNPDGAEELRQLQDAHGGGFEVLHLDVEDQHSVVALKHRLLGHPIDVLLHSAGYYGVKGIDEADGFGRFGESDFTDWIRIFTVNVIGVMRVCEALVENVAASDQRKIVALTSSAGSIGANVGGNQYGYRASKAGLNSIIKSMAVNLADRGIATLTVHPGLVKTDMGGRFGTIDVDTSARGIIDRINTLSPESSGRFLRYDGEQIPW